MNEQQKNAIMNGETLVLNVGIYKHFAYRGAEKGDESLFVIELKKKGETLHCDGFDNFNDFEARVLEIAAEKYRVVA